MFVSRLIAGLFVVVVGGLVTLATLLRDPADSATRLPAELDVENVDLASAPFDGLAGAYEPFDATTALTATQGLAIAQLNQLASNELATDLDEATLTNLIAEAVTDRITPAKVSEFYDILTDGAPEVSDAAEEVVEEDATAPANPLVLTAEEQRIINFGDAVAAETIEAFIALQGDKGGLTMALEEAELPAIETAIRPRLKRLPRVTYLEIAQEDYTPLAEVTGSTAVNRRTEVRARTGSPVEEIFVDEGQMVASGDILIRLADDGRQAQRLQALASIAQAEANLISSEANIDASAAQISQAETSLSDAQESQADVLALEDFASEAQRRNAASGVLQAEQNLAVARSGLAQAEAGLAQAQASLESAEAALVQIDLDIERLTIRAPFAGRIEDRFVELGAAVNPGDPVVRLADVETMLAQAQVSDRLRQDLSLGDMAQVRVGDGDTALNLEGPITFISATSNAATRTFLVEVELQNQIMDGELLIVDNQFATVTFASDSEPTYRIPQSALTSASIAGSSDGTTGLLSLDGDNHVTFTKITYADYNEGGELLIHADRLGAGPIRLIVGRGGFVEVGDQVDARAQPADTKVQGE